MSSTCVTSIHSHWHLCSVLLCPVSLLRQNVHAESFCIFCPLMSINSFSYKYLNCDLYFSIFNVNSFSSKYLNWDLYLSIFTLFYFFTSKYSHWTLPYLWSLIFHFLNIHIEMFIFHSFMSLLLHLNIHIDVCMFRLCISSTSLLNISHGNIRYFPSNSFYLFTSKYSCCPLFPLILIISHWNIC